MGMLMAMTMLEQEEAARKAAETAVPEVKEEIPFTEPEERVEEPVKETKVRKPTATRRRKTVK